MKNLTTFFLTLLLSVNVAMADAPDWAVNSPAFSNSMVIVGAIFTDKTESIDTDDILAAFVNGEVRGVSHLSYQEDIDRYLAFMIVYSNTSNEQINFKLYDASADQEFDVVTTLDFQVNGLVGDPGSPYVWSNLTLNDQTIIEAFSFPETIGNSTISTNEVVAPVTYGIDLSELTASFAVSEGATVTISDQPQESGVTTNDFTESVIYTVLSEDEQQRKEYTVHVVYANLTPTDILLSNQFIQENTSASALIGELTAEDDDADHTFSLVAGEGDNSNNAFRISGNELLAAQSFNYESKREYSIRLQVSDEASNTFEKTAIINIGNVNEPPEDFNLSTLTFGETNTIGAEIATLSTEDPDLTDRFTYTLLSTFEDHDYFAIEDNKLISLKPIDFESKQEYRIRIKVEDRAQHPISKTFKLLATDENDHPTDILLSTDAVLEKLPFGSVISEISAVDQDVSDNHYFGLVEGDSARDNSLVYISGSQLLVRASQSSDTKKELMIRVKATDPLLGAIEKGLIINILDVNDSPSDLSLTNQKVQESDTIGFQIGQFLVKDAAPSQMSYSFIEGTNDNSFFEIVGDQLVLLNALDFELKPEYIIDVLGEHESELSTTNRLVIEVSDVNEAPEDIILNNNTIKENALNGGIVGSLLVADPDFSDSHSFSLPASELDNAQFIIDDNGFVNSINTFDFETQSKYTISVVVVDQAGLTLSKTIDIDVLDQNEPPRLVNPLSNIDVLSRQQMVISIPDDMFLDEDQGDELTISVTLNGSSLLPSWILFMPEDNTISITPPDEIDLPSYDLHIQATDRAGLSATNVLEVSMARVTAVDKFKANVSVYPNPAITVLKIDLPSDEKLQRWEAAVRDLSGRIILYPRVLESGGINVSGLVRGTYLLELRHEDYFYYHKFIKN
ncbi:MAG: cadherin domain-containing protein [Cyclobacteriaceae bacterium]